MLSGHAVQNTYYRIMPKKNSPRLRALTTTGSITTLTIAGLLTGCSTPQPQSPQEAIGSALPETTLIPTKWAEPANSSAIRAGWLEDFNDDALDAYVDQVIANNLTLRALLYRVDAAAAAARKAGAPLMPQVAASGSADTLDSYKNSTGGSDTTEVNLGVSWELDVWGRLRAQRNAAQASYDSIASDLEYAKLSLAAQASKLWFQATETHQQVEYAREVLQTQERTLEIVQAKFDEGKKEVYLSRSDVNTAQDRRVAAELTHKQAIRTLEILAGRYPEDQMHFNQTFATIPTKIPAGLPSDLIERRPDLAASSKRVNAAFELITEAKASRLPQFSLTAGTGHKSSDLLDLLGAEHTFWSIGGNFLAPIFTGGALKEQVNIRTAEQAAALAEFGQSALIAFSEVENALSADALLAEREAFLTAVSNNNQSALEIAQIQFESGKLDLLSVLQMQNRVIQSRVALISIKTVRLSKRVDLHLALGGNY